MYNHILMGKKQHDLSAKNNYLETDRAVDHNNVDMLGKHLAFTSG